MRIDYERVMTAGFGVLILGVAWLVFWLGPAFPLYEGDVRWAHNFAFALIFIIVGLASWKRSVSSGIIAVIASFLMVPAELAFFSGETATGIAGVFFALMLAVIVIERQTGKDLVRPPPRLNAWLRIHLLTFAYIGIAHMPFIFFFVRWYAADPFLLSLPVEHEPSTSIFNAMLVILVILAIMERYVKTIGRFRVSRAGFYWAVLMLLLPLASIGIFGE